MLYQQIQIVIQFRGGCASNRVPSWRTGRQIAIRVAEHSQWCPCTRATPRNVEFVSRKNSGRERKGEPVFVPQPVEWVMLPQGVH